MCGFSRRPGCIEITIKLGGKTLAHKSNGAYSAHTLAKNANVWGTRQRTSRMVTVIQLQPLKGL